jgi:chemotaxis protein methyltransferase WspC
MRYGIGYFTKRGKPSVVLPEIETLLAQTIGLDAASVGLSTIERAVQLRMEGCGLKDQSSYLARVLSSTDELQELVEAVVVSETWFFRDQEAFAALGKFVTDEWLPARSPNKLRLLSIPCATGEEAYSMAMTLEGIGLPADIFEIVAVDISERALERARQAVYSKNSFRVKDLDFRDRYFEVKPQGYHLSDGIRRQVLFQQGNLLSPDFLPGSHLFHFIFCRNLLIYLDLSAQNRAIQTLKRLLTPEGLLFVGPAETALMQNHHLVSARRSLAFAFRHGSAFQPKQPAEKKIARLVRVPIMPPAPIFKAKAHLKTQRISRTRALPVLSGKMGVDLKMASQLADEGRLPEAVKVCENYLKRHPSSMEALYLLGVVYDATGNKEKARECYRKVLYLNPEHYESLMHLAYAAEKEGDAATAQNLRARASRVKERVQHV